MPRIRGYKTGGRQPGSLNKCTAELRELAQQYTLGAIQRLSSIMNNPKASYSDQISAASVLLDRGHGKAMQSIESHNVNEQHYVRVMPRMDDAEWRSYLEYKRANLPAAVPKQPVIAPKVDGNQKPSSQLKTAH